MDPDLPCAASFDTVRHGIEDIINGIYLEIMGERYMHKRVIMILR